MKKVIIFFLFLSGSVNLSTVCSQIVGNRLDELPARSSLPDVPAGRPILSDVSNLDATIKAAIDSFSADHIRKISQAQTFDSIFFPNGRLGHRGGRLGAETVSKEMEAVVAAGPASLPRLVVLLRDQTPTGVVIDQSVMNNSEFQFAIRSGYFSANDAVPREFEFFSTRMWLHNKTAAKTVMVDKYNVRRGDVAMILLGQITNRRYDLTHRELPKSEAFVAGCGGLEGRKYGETLVEYWQSDNPGQRLFDSLVADFYTRPVFDFEVVSILDEDHNELQFHRNDPMDLQLGALVRLMKYFPRQAEHLVIGRIDGFRDSNEGNLLNDENGVRVIDFVIECLKANSPGIDDALKRLKSRTSDRELISIFDNYENER